LVPLRQHHASHRSNECYPAELSTGTHEVPNNEQIPPGPRSLRLDDGARIDVDGVAPDESVFVEIFAHQGWLKGAQFHKVTRDAAPVFLGER
jgi:hypothetical protein